MKPDPDKKTARGWLRGWRLPALLALLILGELIAARALHRSKEELQDDLQTGSPTEKAFALHILANRDIPEGFDQRGIRRLMQNEEVFLRELTMTTNLMRFGTENQRLAYIARRGSTPEAYRCRFLLECRVGNKGMSMEQLDRFFEESAD